jgi:hemolysin activation/secretion protein
LNLGAKTIRRSLFIAGILSCTGPAVAQSNVDAGVVLGRDIGVPSTQKSDVSTVVPIVGADQTAISVPDIGSGVMVGAIKIEGTSQIEKGAFTPVIETYLGQQADTQKLQSLARAIADQARARGYIFASAIIPPQSVETGIVTVRLDEGHVDQIRISGSNNRRLWAVLGKIVGKGVQKSVVERQLLLAEDIPGIAILSTRYVREGRLAVLNVDVREDHHSGSISADNAGSRSIGPARLILRYELTGLADQDDVLTVQAVVTPLQPKELAYGSVRYAHSIGTNGAQVGVAGALGRTKPGETSGIIVGKSRYVAVFANQPVLRSNTASIWLNTEFAYLSVKQNYNGVQAQSDTLATFTFAASGSTVLAGGRLSGGVGVVQGLNIFGATRSGDLLASRRDASGSFTKGLLWLNWSGALMDHLTLRLAANGQIASRPLLAAQELGLGGPGFGRGYDFSERFGDNGILGLAELRRQFDHPLQGVDWMQLYGFIDGGVVGNLASGFGSGTLLSSGGGLRAAMGKTEIGVEAAFPLNEMRYESGNKRPRVNLSVGYNF